jgi:uncharacterized membrane protein (DUF4010 family)
MELKPFSQIGISLLLGLLIGLQRQRTESTIGVFRTFPLIAAFGTICGWLALEHGGWVIAAGLVALAALLVVSNYMMVRAGNHDAGQTTEIAALLMFGVGAYGVVGEPAVAVALGGVIAVLLHFKDPVLPNRSFGPNDVAYKLLGARQGALLGGVVGGLVSSTATTVSFARRAAATPASAGLAALVIMIASGVVHGRVMAEVSVVAPHQLRTMLPPLAATQAEFGVEALYPVAVLSGLTDMDAITLSTSQLVSHGRLEADAPCSGTWRRLSGRPCLRAPRSWRSGRRPHEFRWHTST